MLSLDKLSSIITEFESLGGEILEISGGEPLLHPQLIEVIKFASRKGLETILYTSGNLLNSGSLMPIERKLANELYKAGLSKVIFSLQGASSNIHEILTQTVGSYKNVLESIRNMKNAGFWVGIHFVPTKLNYLDFGKIHDLCESLRVNELAILRFVSQGRGYTNERLLQLTLPEFQTFNNIIKTKNTKDGFSTMRLGRPIDFSFKEETSCTKGKCDAGITRCLVTPDGKVVPCPAFKQIKLQEIVMGNINEKTLANIWNDPKWSTFRNFNYTKISEPCKSCSYLDRCQGGCKAQRLLKYTNLYSGPDPYCECTMLKWVLNRPCQEAPRKLLPAQ
jgi:pyrroloquinoline quinone biosynthesis protein E